MLVGESAPDALGTSALALIDSEQDIFPRREPRQQCRGLKHHAAVQPRPDHFAPGDDYAAFAGIV
jgi:hypothetical protein